MIHKKGAARLGCAVAMVAGAALAVPGLAGATTNSVTQTLSGTIATTVTLAESAAGTGLSAFVPGTTSTAATPTLNVFANTTYTLTVAPAWSVGQLSHPMRVAMSVTQPASDTNSRPAAHTVSLAWGSTTPASVTIGTGSALKSSTTVAPDTFTGTISQPVSYADAPGRYSVTLTYAAAPTV